MLRKPIFNPKLSESKDFQKIEEQEKKAASSSGAHHKSNLKDRKKLKTVQPFEEHFEIVPQLSDLSGCDNSNIENEK